MRESLRGRLLVWHTVTTTLVVAVFGAAVCYLAWRDRLTDIDAALGARAAMLASAVRPAGGDRVDVLLGPPLPPGPYEHAIWTADGRLLDRSGASLVALPDAPGLRTREGRRERTVVAASGVRVVVSRDLAPVRQAIWALAARLAIVGAGVLALSIAIGWLLAGRMLAPLARIAGTARRMMAGDLAARVPVAGGGTELDEIGRALNGAFDRLQAAIDRQQRFTADASHELRTPLTALSTETQWALARERTHEEWRRSLGVCARAAARMQAVVERLLAVARGTTAADARVAVRLDRLAAEAAFDLAALAGHRGVTVRVAVPVLPVVGDPDRLREALTNVVANAIHYNRPHGHIAVVGRRCDGQAEVAVADTGTGIDPDDLPYVFDAFYRGQHARRQDPHGAGLGLAVTRAIVERHGGVVRCASRPGHGTCVTISVPAHV
jgi:signal transduction histidine kinase